MTTRRGLGLATVHPDDVLPVVGVGKPLCAHSVVEATHRVVAAIHFRKDTNLGSVPDDRFDEHSAFHVSSDALPPTAADDVDALAHPRVLRWSEDRHADHCSVFLDGNKNLAKIRLIHSCFLVGRPDRGLNAPGVGRKRRGARKPWR
jgi:hypothetical protein